MESPDTQNHPLSGQWFVHYFGDKPWQSISDLDEAAANTIGARVGRSENNSYYCRRLAIEAWDRNHHVARGGRCEHINPVYAVLRDRLPVGHAHEGAWLAIKAESVASNLVSLTLGDSFICHAMAQNGDPSETAFARTYDAAGVRKLLDAGLASDWPPEIDTGGHPFYIEARLYTRALPGIHAAAFASAALVSTNAQFSQGSSALTSPASTVAPHQTRSPAGAALCPARS